MRTWVLDASLALAWVLADPRSEAASQAISERREGDDVCVPALWWYEVANGLTTGRRQGRLSEADCKRAIARYESLDLRLDAAPGPSLAWHLHGLAAEYGLTAYDAAYLELAQRQGATLLTLDARLAKAATRAGVPISPAGGR